jgi:aminopeptidase N
MSTSSSSTPNIPITVRTHEKAQLEDFVPRVEELFRESDLDEQADFLADLELVFENDTAYAAPRDWGRLIQHLTRLREEEGLRVWWLQRKLARRLRERVDDVSEVFG